MHVNNKKLKLECVKKYRPECYAQANKNLMISTSMGRIDATIINSALFYEEMNKLYKNDNVVLLHFISLAILMFSFAFEV